MLFGVVNVVMFGVKHTCGSGVNIISVVSLNFVGRLSGNYFIVGGRKYVWYASIF